MNHVIIMSILNDIHIKIETRSIDELGAADDSQCLRELCLPVSQMLHTLGYIRQRTLRCELRN